MITANHTFGFDRILLQMLRILWMVRIGGGVFPVIKEPNYLVDGKYRVDKGAAPKMLNYLIQEMQQD
ncbi:hypothetical protein ACSBR1_026148 [Camellia fascicularis]